MTDDVTRDTRDNRPPDGIEHRLRGAVAGIRPTSGATLRVRQAVGLRQRRRRTTTAVGSVVVAVAAVLAVTLVALPRAAERPAPADTPVDFGPARPAVLFSTVMGGSARGLAIRYRLVRGERMNAQFTWIPDGADPAAPLLGGVAVEKYDADQPCEQRVAGVVSCASITGGQVARFEVSADEAHLDPISRAATLDADPEARVRGVTYFDDGGLAVSVLVCGCTATGEVVDSFDLGSVSQRELTEVATNRRWIQNRRR